MYVAGQKCQHTNETRQQGRVCDDGSGCGYIVQGGRVKGRGHPIKIWIISEG